MPRRSTRIVPNSSPAAVVSGTKRPLESSPEASAKQRVVEQSSSPSRTRQKGRKLNATRSKYFGGRAQGSPSEEPSSDLSEEEALDESSDYNVDEDRRVEVRSRTRANRPAVAGGRKNKICPDTNRGKSQKGKTDAAARPEAAGGKELWREGVRTGLGPGKEVFIALPKARDPGNVPYEDHTIHPNTMLFLKDLKEHNEREWFKKHDADYRASKKDWDTFVDSFTEKIIEKDSTIPELPAKDLVFRIYRDIRFSKDQTPYKPHFSAAWSRTGRKGRYAAYYLHLQPERCFLAAGLWMPQASDVSALRQDMDRNPQRIKRVLNRPDVRRQFMNGIPNDEKKAVKAFVSQNQESALKSKPMGWDANHKDIELIRLRSYTLGKPLKDDDLLGPGALNRIADLVEVLVPFVTYLNSVVMPDPVDTDEADESDDGDET